MTPAELEGLTQPEKLAFIRYQERWEREEMRAARQARR